MITAFSGLVSVALASDNVLEHLNIAILIGLSAAFTGSAGNVINDILDVETDKVNRPERVLPSRILTKAEANGAYVFDVLLAIVLSMFLNNAILLTIVVFSLISITLYSLYLKGVPLVGNIVVSFFTGLLFIYGGIAVGNPTAGIIPAIFAFLTNLIRELIKDAEDREGDVAVGVYTFPTVYGIRKTKVLSSALLIAIIVLLPLAYKIGNYQIFFLLLSLGMLFPLLLITGYILSRAEDKQGYGRVSNLMKIIMLTGLMAFLWAR